MNTINCLVKINDHHTGTAKNVTPSEVVVLRHLHDREAGGCAVRQPVKSGEALVMVPSDEEDGKPTFRNRTSQEEYVRLRKKYPQRSSPDKPNSSILDDLFPGVSTGLAKLPETFQELPEKYALQEPIAAARKANLKTKEKREVVPVSEEQRDAIENASKPLGDLTKLSKAKLLELATEKNLVVDPAATKAQILEALNTPVQQTAAGE